MKIYPDLSQVSEFIVVAATLLDMKAARLLPAEEADEEDIAALEARDVLFARLLQYRAYKQASMFFARRLIDNDGSVARSCDDPIMARIPVELVRTADLATFSALAADALRPVQTDATMHLHSITHPVGPEAKKIMQRLATVGFVDFETLIEDTHDIHKVVSRFLAVLILYRDGFIDFEQDGFGCALHIALNSNQERAFDDDIMEQMNY